MEVEEFFQQGKWLPAFGLLAGGALTFHFPSEAHQQSAKIEALRMDKGYSSKVGLCQGMAMGAFHLAKEVKAAQGQGRKSVEVVRLRHLGEILEGIISDADQHGMREEHAVVYLALKFLALLVSLDAISSKKNGYEVEGTIGIKNWLLQAHALLFQSKEKRVDSRIDFLRWGEYEKLLMRLREDRNSATGPQRRNQIDLVLEMVWNKLNNVQLNRRVTGKGMRLQAASMRLYKDKSAQLFRGQKGSQLYETISQVLLGSKNHISKVCDNSWPLRVLHHMQAAQSDTSVSDFVSSILSELQLNEVGSVLCGLLTGNYIHQMYQSMLNCTSPFLAHLTALLYHSCRHGSALLCLMHEEYVSQMARNLLFEASEVSYQTLVLAYSALNTFETCQKLGQMVEPLLLSYLSPLSVYDTEDLNEVIKRIDCLTRVDLSHLALGTYDTLYTQMTAKNILNKEMFIVYCSLAALQPSNPSLTAHFEGHVAHYFCSDFGTESALEQYDEALTELKTERHGQRRKIKHLQALQPIFANIQHMLHIRREQDGQLRLVMISQVMQKSQRSIIKLTLVLENLQRVAAHTGRTTLQQQFMANVHHFVQRFPQLCTPAEQSVLSKIGSLLG